MIEKYNMVIHFLNEAQVENARESEHKLLNLANVTVQTHVS